MTPMISVASGFQYSVNIGYDLNNEEKIKNFIPTTSALELIESLLLSTNASSTERSRVLIGAYGTGKSHIMLTALSLLMKKDRLLFQHICSRTDHSRLQQLIQNYYDSDNKILPVVISGSSTSLTQAFLLALQRTLAAHECLDIMPETNYRAAVAAIERWQTEFPDTYQKFCTLISKPVAAFVAELKDFNTRTYEEFEQVFPQLTAGSVFNPFLGFDVVELYENAAQGLKKKGYSGIFVVYDEFSKYLEANIAAATVSDTKMLQDFAEKCNRSGNTQMHIMLISHKEIANYIDVLPKQKVDGWRGVSERFAHVRLSNNFNQTYEIISAVIRKEPQLWQQFLKVNQERFSDLTRRYQKHPIFAGLSAQEIHNTIEGCYPLHPVSTFILPRLSERVAQNERTLFTFLSANGVSTLPSYLNEHNEQQFALISPDQIYDYFEPLFKKEINSGALHDNYILTEMILEQLDPASLESKIVKCISLIYILEQFETLRPTKEELFGIFRSSFTHEEIDAAITSLIEQEFVVYLKRSNGYLQLKQSSGVDIQQKITNLVESQRHSVSVTEALNEVNLESYMYPSRYNDSHEMIRYFNFNFIPETMLQNQEQLTALINHTLADGVIFGVLPTNPGSTDELAAQLKALSADPALKRAVFVVPRGYHNIENSVREFKAVLELREQAIGDRILFEEYEVVYEDLRDLIGAFTASYTHPELFQSRYIYKGEEQTINRKAALSELLSGICDICYARTPVINNEALNRNEATTIARNSRHKVVSALLRTELEPNLGLAGTGQDISIMRSTLVRTGVLKNYEESSISLNLAPENNPLMADMLREIKDFILSVKKYGTRSFGELYELLCGAENGIALRKELVPIYLAAVLHEFKQHIFLTDHQGQVALSADILFQINAHPENFSLGYLNWSQEKSDYVQHLERIFAHEVVAEERSGNPYDFVITAMKRWYLSLPRYVKEMRTSPDGSGIDQGYQGMLRLLKQNPSGHEFLFAQLPQVFDTTDFATIAAGISAARDFYDNGLRNLRAFLINRTKELFKTQDRYQQLPLMSLSSVITDWCESLDQEVFAQLFADGTDRCLNLLRTVSNDEDNFISRLAKVITDLRVEDWSDDTVTRFFAILEQNKNTAEAFHSTTSQANALSKDDSAPGNNQSGAADTYQITFALPDGTAETKRFQRVETSGRAKLLQNKLLSDLESFGQALTENEKRQVLMEVLKKLC